MIHPLLHRLVAEPGLFVDHASGYAELATLEAQAAVAAWRRRLLLLVAALLLGGAALVFSGMAVLLVAAVPIDGMPAPPLLWGLPLAAWLAAALCAWAGARATPAPAFAHLRAQWTADLQLARDLAGGGR